MTKPKDAVNHKTHGHTNDVTQQHRALNTSITQSPGSSGPSPATSVPTTVARRRTDAALKPATPLEVLVSRSLDQELAWYFVYGEMALVRGDVSMLPSSAAARAFAARPDGDFAAEAFGLAQEVRRCLQALRAPHASVLRAAYSPRQWPDPVERTFESVAAIAVRLALAEDPWPPRGAKKGLEESAASRLSSAIVARRPKLRVGKLRARAERMLGSAIVAYAVARSEEGTALELA
jgi:hypothetical protein